MKRKDFLKKFGIGLGVVAVAPAVIKELAKDDFEILHQDATLTIFKHGEGTWREEYDAVWGSGASYFRRKKEYIDELYKVHPTVICSLNSPTTPFSGIVKKGRKAKITDKQLRRFREND